MIFAHAALFVILCVVLAILVNRFEKRGSLFAAPRYFLVLDEYEDSETLLSALETGKTKSALSRQYSQILKTDRVDEHGFSLLNMRPRDVVYVVNTGSVYEYDRHLGLVLSSTLPAARHLSVNPDFGCVMACFKGRWQVTEGASLHELQSTHLSL